METRTRLLLPTEIPENIVMNDALVKHMKKYDDTKMIYASNKLHDGACIPERHGFKSLVEDIT